MKNDISDTAARIWAAWSDKVNFVNRQEPMSAQQIKDLQDQQIRGTGIDPATGKPISPIYAKSIQKTTGVDPNDQKAVQSWMDKARAAVSAQAQKDFTSFNPPPPSSGLSFMSKLALLALAGGFVGLYVVPKVLQR